MAARSKAAQRTIWGRILVLHGLLMACTIGGVLVALLLPASFGMSSRILAGWDCGIAAYLLISLIRIAPADVAQIKRRAEIDDEGATIVLLLTMLAVGASLAAAVIFLGEASSGGQTAKIGAVAFAVGTIVLSWLFMHTMFALHYAHEFYGDRQDHRTGGLDFPGNAAPEYWDFFYFSAVIAMTSQVSDVGITSKYIRRVATAHGILSFFYNLVILALTVNILAGAISGGK